MKKQVKKQTILHDIGSRYWAELKDTLRPLSYMGKI